MAEPILVVDDNPTNLKLLQYLLAAKGYAVRTAVDSVTALASLQEVTPRLILMDLQIPGIDKFELTRQLKADSKTRGILIIAVSAYAMKGNPERALTTDCDHYLAKPIDTRTLPDLLAGFLKAAAETSAKA